MSDTIRLGTAVGSALLAVIGVGTLLSDEDLSAVTGSFSEDFYRTVLLVSWFAPIAALLNCWRQSQAWAIIATVSWVTVVSNSSPVAWFQLDTCRNDENQTCLSGGVLTNFAVMLAVYSTLPETDNTKAPGVCTGIAVFGAILVFAGDVVYWSSDFMNASNAHKDDAWKSIATSTVMSVFFILAILASQKAYAASAVSLGALLLIDHILGVLETQAEREKINLSADNTIWAAELAQAAGLFAGLISVMFFLWQRIPAVGWEHAASTNGSQEPYEFMALPVVTVSCGAVLVVVGAIILWTIEDFGLEQLSLSNSTNADALWRVSILLGWLPVAFAIGNVLKPHPLWMALCFGVVFSLASATGALEWRVVDRCRQLSQKDADFDVNDNNNCAAGGILSLAGILLGLFVVLPPVVSKAVDLNSRLAAVFTAVLALTSAILIWQSNDLHNDSYRVIVHDLLVILLLACGFFILAAVVVGTELVVAVSLTFLILGLNFYPPFGLFALNQATEALAGDDEKAFVALGSITVLVGTLTIINVFFTVHDAKGDRVLPN